MKNNRRDGRFVAFALLVIAASWPLWQASAQHQELFVANNSSDFQDTIFRYSSSGSLMGNLGVGAPLHDPVGLAFGSQGELYVANIGNNTILRYSSSGAFLGIFASSGLAQPSGLAFDSTGALWVCNYGDGSISKYSSSGALLSHVMTGVLDMSAITLDKNDNIFVSNSNQGPGFGVFRFAPDGSHKTLFATGELDARGLAFDNSGMLYVVDGSANSVRRFAPDGTDLGIFASTGLNHPFAEAFDASGNLYVSNQIGGGIRRFSANGQDLGTFAVISTTPANPVGLAFSPVPEPGPLALSLTAACVFHVIRRKA